MITIIHGFIESGDFMEISRRLEWIASFVKQGERVADIGTDHGYIPIYLAQNKTSPKVLRWILTLDLWIKQKIIFALTTRKIL